MLNLWVSTDNLMVVGSRFALSSVHPVCRVLFMNAPIPAKRRRDAVGTRAKILAAAIQCFSELGYTAAGIRDVAAVAGVSYTMVGKYFGSKAGLLAEALSSTMDLDPVLRVDRNRFGENLARLIVDTVGNDAPISMTILTAGDPEARQLAGLAVDKHVIRPLADWLGEPAGKERAVAITMVTGGFVTFTQHIPLDIEPIGVDHPIVRWLATSIQQIVDGNTGWSCVSATPV